MTEEFDVPATIEAVSASLHRAYSLVPTDDIRQELWVWYLEHPDKVSECHADGEHGANRLRLSLRRAGGRYASAETKRRQELTGKVGPQ